MARSRLSYNRTKAMTNMDLNNFTFQDSREEAEHPSLLNQPSENMSPNTRLKMSRIKNLKFNAYGRKTKNVDEITNKKSSMTGVSKVSNMKFKNKEIN